MGLAVPHVGTLAVVTNHREARNSHCLAPERISPLLDVKDSEREARGPAGPARSSRSDPPHEQSESGLGRARNYGELLKLGINIGETSVRKYLIRIGKRRPKGGGLSSKTS